MMNQPTGPSNLAIFMGIPGSMHQGQMSPYSDRKLSLREGPKCIPRMQSTPSLLHCITMFEFLGGTFCVYPFCIYS